MKSVGIEMTLGVRMCK